MGDDPDGLAHLLFPAAGKKWLLTRKPYLKERTYYGYGQCIDRLSVFFEHLPLNKIHLNHIRHYVAQRTANDITVDPFIELSIVRQYYPEPIAGWPKSAGPSITKHEISVLQMILKRAGLWKHFATSYEPLRIPTPKKQKTLEPDEERRVFEMAAQRPAWELAIWVAAIMGNTGASGTELRHTHMNEVHMDAEIPHFFVNEEFAKNDFRPRRIALNDTALWFMKKCYLRAKTLGCCDPDDFMFPLREKPGVWNPKKPAGSSWMRRAFASLREAAKLPWLTPHCFRHQCTTLLYENDVDEMTIQHTLGHESTYMTRKYSHNRLRKQKQALQLIDPKVRLGVKSYEFDTHEEDLKINTA